MKGKINQKDYDQSPVERTYMDLKTFSKCFRKIYDDMPKEPVIKNLADENRELIQ